jgi:hypothetical protein
MKIVKFNKSGGPIKAKVTCGHAQPGAYTLLLWEADKNRIVMEKKGNFINPDDDSYKLPIPNKGNNGRIIDCLSTVVITPPIQDYKIGLQITQDDKVLEEEIVSGRSEQLTISVEMFLKLLAK